MPTTRSALYTRTETQKGREGERKRFVCSMMGLLRVLNPAGTRPPTNKVRTQKIDGMAVGSMVLRKYVAMGNFLFPFFPLRSIDPSLSLRQHDTPCESTSRLLVLSYRRFPILFSK